MKKHRVAAALCAAALALGLAAPAGAAPGVYPDLPESHWAYSYMDRAAQLKLLLGVGEGRMAPDQELTWAQCLTIAARTFAPAAYAQAQGESWELAAYGACLDAGILLPAGQDFLNVTGDAASLSRPISRQDTAVLLARAIPEEVTGRRTELDPETWEDIVLTAQDTLADYGALPPAYQAAVERLFDLEIVQGSPVEGGSGEGYRFNGGDILHRADGAALFLRALDALDSCHYGEEKTVTVHLVDDQGAPLAPDLQVEAAVGRSLTYAVSSQVDGLDALHYYTLYPENGRLSTYQDTRVSTACAEYTLVYYPMSERERAQQDFFDAVLRGELSMEDYWWQSFHRYEQGENELKHYILFGDQNKRRFDSEEEAQAGQTTVTVPLWRINSQGVKYSAQGSFSVNAAIAEDVVAIFTEIYNDPEQFPIQDLGGYGWRGDSATGEHNCGTAIDINPNENYQIRDGEVLVGNCWAPGENPYSIDPDGSVVRIFAQHGWSWGGDAWAWSDDPASGYHDYMHFSYMGG